MVPLLMVVLWAPHIQTIGHVWLFVSILTSGIMGLKLAVPHAWLFLVLAFVWWGLSTSYNTYILITYASLALVTLFGRNLNYFFNSKKTKLLYKRNAGVLNVFNRFLKVCVKEICLYHKSQKNSD